MTLILTTRKLSGALVVRHSGSVAIELIRAIWFSSIILFSMLRWRRESPPDVSLNLTKGGKTVAEIARIDQYLTTNCPAAHGFKIGGMYTDLTIDTATPERLKHMTQFHERHAVVHPNDNYSTRIADTLKRFESANSVSQQARLQE